MGGFLGCLQALRPFGRLAERLVVRLADGVQRRAEQRPDAPRGDEQPLALAPGLGGDSRRGRDRG